jgi:hypothetical protein
MAKWGGRSHQALPREWTVPIFGELRHARDETRQITSPFRRCHWGALTQLGETAQRRVVSDAEKTRGLNLGY